MVLVQEPPEILQGLGLAEIVPGIRNEVYV
jgi:hypothetical protein